ncbi:unnamed protein product, partial [marine sediment metagenome]
LSGVFIAARKIINRGEISSEGPDVRTEIITEDYKGNGVVRSKITKGEIRKWFSMDNPLIWLIFFLIASFIIFKFLR